VQFLVLGPVCLRRADQPPGCDDDGEVTAPKQRALLAVLLISRNRVVPVDRLVAELWEQPPPTATNVLRQYVSKLRKLLRPELFEGVGLRTYSAGYELRCGELSSDAHHFEQLLRTARSSFRAGDVATAQQSVERALGMWRGDAYCDVPAGPRVSAERARLDELRIGAEELAAEIKLRDGNVVDAVSELTALTMRNPFRENAHANLMRALSGAGRKAEALRVYGAVRHKLMSELGVEPCSELRGLQLQILEGALD
jgi:DNA-binding SARP family transcriptional activator